MLALPVFLPFCDLFFFTQNKLGRASRTWLTPSQNIILTFEINFSSLGLIRFVNSKDDTNLLFSLELVWTETVVTLRKDKVFITYDVSLMTSAHVEAALSDPNPFLADITKQIRIIQSLTCSS